MRDPDALSPLAVEQAQHGDAAARDRLLQALTPMLRGYFTARIGAQAEVDDLVQNTLLRVHQSLEVLQQPDRLKGFTMKAALFELQDYYRGRYSSKEMLYDPSHPPNERATQGTGAVQVDVERALQHLSPNARRIIELRESGYRYAEIADLIGSTEAAIKMQVKRAFEKMRKLFL